jgi:tetratricopeptide (TPR) repeat protein
MNSIDRAKKIFLDGLDCLDSGDFANAEKLFSETLSLAPKSVPTLTNLAIAQYKQGKISQASSTCKKVLEVDAGNIDALRMAATCSIEQSQYDEALKTLEDMIALDASDAEAYCNQSFALNRTHRHHEAIISADRAIERQPNFPGAYVNRGNSLRSLKRHEEALADYDRALALKPDLAEAWLGRANVFADLQRQEDAIHAYEKALELKPDMADAWLGRGNVFAQRKRHEAALADYDKALALKSDLADAWVGRGNVLTELKAYENALAGYDKVLARHPDSAEAWLGRGNVFSDLRRHEDALAAYEKVLTVNPNSAEAWLGLGNVFNDLRRHDDARAAYEKVLTINPNSAEAWLGRGNVFAFLNKDDEAFSCFDRAISLKQDLAESHYAKSALKLSLGEYEEGWRLYEWRWRCKTFSSPRRDFAQALWLGDHDLAGKTLLIHAEQGLGDAIQFYRYVPLLEAPHCRILFETPKPLKTLFEEQGGKCQVIGRGESLPHFDLHCPLMSLPLAFKSSLETIPNAVPYLRADEKRASDWQMKLGKKTKPRIGIAWSGNPQYQDDDKRSIRLRALLPVISDGAEWISLQKDVRDHDREALEGSKSINNLGPVLDDFSDIAALISQLDLVISVDTAFGHLAGALGLPTWILLASRAEFRWLRDREDSPWYPKTRLFRQTKDGDWGDVLDRISAALRAEFGIA